MDKNIEITLLYDIYGKLLTKKQQEIFEEYYLYNLSLREIAQNREISYQGVRDSIKSSENMLKSFDNKVGMLNLIKRTNKAYEICSNCKDLNSYKEDLINLLR